MLTAAGRHARSVIVIALPGEPGRGNLCSTGRRSILEDRIEAWRVTGFPFDELLPSSQQSAITTKGKRYKILEAVPVEKHFRLTRPPTETW
jgi:hypothetical protein